MLKKNIYDLLLFYFLVPITLQSVIFVHICMLPWQQKEIWIQCKTPDDKHV